MHKDSFLNPNQISLAAQLFLPIIHRKRKGVSKGSAANSDNIYNQSNSKQTARKEIENSHSHLADVKIMDADSSQKNTKEQCRRPVFRADRIREILVIHNLRRRIRIRLLIRALVRLIGLLVGLLLIIIILLGRRSALLYRTAIYALVSCKRISAISTIWHINSSFHNSNGFHVNKRPSFGVTNAGRSEQDLGVLPRNCFPAINSLS